MGNRILFELALPEPHLVKSEAYRYSEMVFGNEFNGGALAIDVLERYVDYRFVCGKGKTETASGSDFVHIVPVYFQIRAIVEDTCPVVDVFEIVSSHVFGRNSAPNAIFNRLLNCPLEGCDCPARRFVNLASAQFW